MKIYTPNLNRFLYCEIFRCDFFRKDSNNVNEH